MINAKKNSIIIAASILLFLIIGLASFQQQQQQQQLHHFAAYAGREGEACIDNDQSKNTITITCDVSFRDVANTINDRMILEQLGNGEYLLNANLQVDDGFTEGNHVYNNTISNSEDGIREIRSDGNILEDNKFFNIESDDEEDDE